MKQKQGQYLQQWLTVISVVPLELETANTLYGKNALSISKSSIKNAEEGKKTLILEAVTDSDGYIWYTFFGERGSLNNLTVPVKSSIVSRIFTGDFKVR